MNRNATRLTVCFLCFFTLAALALAGLPSGGTTLALASAPPDTTILSFTGSSITYTGTDDVGVVGFECALDGSGFIYACGDGPGPISNNISGIGSGCHLFEVRAVDAEGNVDPTPASMVVGIGLPLGTICPGQATPCEEIANLMGSVQELELPAGTTKSLLAKLDAALSSIQAGNDGASTEQLDAFINALLAQSGKKIDPVDADALVAAAQAIVDAIESGEGCDG